MKRRSYPNHPNPYTAPRQKKTIRRTKTSQTRRAFNELLNALYWLTVLGLIAFMAHLFLGGAA